MGLLAHTESPANPYPAGATVLVVDDDAGKRMAIRAMLATLGHEVIEADSGREALRAVLRQPIAVILMDVRMPGLDGYETARLIRERDDFALIPIIFVTAYGLDEADTTTAYASGAVDFLFTPINDDALRAKVSVFVDLFVQAQQLKNSLDSLTAVHLTLRDAETRARAVLNGASDGIVTTDANGRIETFNTSAQRLFGYREIEMIGQPFEVLIAPDHHNRLPQLIRPESSQARSSPVIETVGLRKDGSSFAIDIGMTETVLDGQTFAVESIRDITARKQHFELERQQAAATRREFERDRMTFDEAPIGSVIISPSGEIVRANKALCRMTGYSSKELVGKLWSELSDDADRPRSAGACAHSARTRHLDRRYLHRDGSTIEAVGIVTQITQSDASAPYFYAQLQDVTQARRSSRELEQAQFEMLARLAAAAELHDDDTGQHTRRVGELSEGIARELGLPDEDMKMLRFAAPLHDIGKLGISELILGKPAKLTRAEFDTVKTHTTRGADMLSGSRFPLIKLAEQIALTHHERWDGSGYPAGLAGEAIPIAGRIVAVADVFDALTHSRPYKRAWTRASALSEMRRQDGRHFDPEVLAAFLRSLNVSGMPRAKGTRDRGLAGAAKRR